MNAKHAPKWWLEERQRKRRDGYETVDSYYWYEVAIQTEDDDPPEYDTLPRAEQDRIDDLFQDYLIEERERQEEIWNPEYYYGTSR